MKFILTDSEVREVLREAAELKIRKDIDPSDCWIQTCGDVTEIGTVEFVFEEPEAKRTAAT